MKKLFIFSILFLSAFNQNAQSTINNGRYFLCVKKESLNNLTLIGDISPDLWTTMRMPNTKRKELDQLRQNKYSLGYYLYPKGGYDEFVQYVSVEISTTCNGKQCTASSRGKALSEEQKHLLNNTDLGSDATLKIKFYLTDIDNLNHNNELIDGEQTITIVPEKEAEFPGGYSQIAPSLMQSIQAKTFEKMSLQSLQQLVVRFTITEIGNPVDIKIIKSSMDLRTDQLMIDIINNMKGWKPAENSKGIKQRQEFTIPLGGSGGC